MKSTRPQLVGKPSRPRSEGKQPDSSNGSPPHKIKPQEVLDNLLTIALAEIKKTKEERGGINYQLELEAKFGTKGIKRITKIDYDNVIKRLLSNGFTKSSDELMLRIQPEFTDINTGYKKISNTRIEISGERNIKEFCKTNSLENLLVNYGQKMPHKIEATGEVLRPADFDDWNFRVTTSRETKINETSGIAQDIKTNWSNTKKIYRLINRVTYTNDTSVEAIPFKVDLSIVKESHKNLRGKTIPENNIHEAQLFDDDVKYEIELELINKRVKYTDGTKETINRILKKLVSIVLAGLQQTNYVISYPEQTRIIQDYMRLTQKTEYKDDMRVYSKHFIGPSSYTLQLNNISEVTQDSIVPNIRRNYTVTDKADGERKLLYINNGKIYLIDTNMNVQNTGVIVSDSNMFNNTIIDGEHISHDKTGRFINLYAAFDLYYLDGEDKRSLGFAPTTTEEAKMPQLYRLSILSAIITNLRLKPDVGVSRVPIILRCKHFEFGFGGKTIFEGCHSIMQKNSDGLFDYNTDGLIFTPADKGVATNAIGIPSPNEKVTWDYSFKWKPPMYNTIDFLVTTQKNKSGQDTISNIVKAGLNVGRLDQTEQYKTLILRVGFDERKHGYINPCNDVYTDNLPDADNPDSELGYRPVRFIPTEPFDPDAGICNIKLKTDEYGNPNMITEEGEVFEDNMIVEFSYNLSVEDKRYRWVPLRVRYDKTSEFRTGLKSNFKYGPKNFGNAFHVANSNWRSIHIPITEEMITTGNNIPSELANDDVYYNRTTTLTKTRGLRDFHNLYVKKLLITSVARRGNTLIDYAVGEGGDWPKWIAANLSFIFGVDVHKENIENRLRGACARYLNYRKKFKIMPTALFVHGNSTENIKTTAAIYSEKGKQITNAVFGVGAKDKDVLGQGVYKHYGVASQGFDISSLQFAIHYMFENQLTLQNLLRNISECTKLNGYLIGTTYDGETVFKMLRRLKKGEKEFIMDNGTKIWEVTKQYDSDKFEPNETSIGYTIDVYQESINKTFPEYLVNFEYLVRLMENYGFVVVSREEARRLGLPNGSGMFRELFNEMEGELKRNPDKADEYQDAPRMSSGERTISFLNRYFVFKKVRTVNSEEVARSLLDSSQVIATQVLARPSVQPAEAITEELERQGLEHLKEPEVRVELVSEPIPEKVKERKTRVSKRESKTEAKSEAKVELETVPEPITIKKKTKKPLLVISEAEPEAKSTSAVVAEPKPKSGSPEQPQTTTIKKSTKKIQPQLSEAEKETHKKTKRKIVIVNE